MSTLTYTERAHEAFFRKMADEGVCIEYVNPPSPVRHMDYVAYRDPDGLCGYGATAEDAYLHLIEQEE